MSTSEIAFVQQKTSLLDYLPAAIIKKSPLCLIRFEVFSARRPWISGFCTERFRKNSKLYEMRLRTAAVCHLKSNLATPQNFQGLTYLAKAQVTHAV